MRNIRRRKGHMVGQIRPAHRLPVFRRVKGPLSGTVKSSGLPKHWTPKTDADEIVRLREEFRLMLELEKWGSGWCSIVW